MSEEGAAGETGDSEEGEDGDAGGDGATVRHGMTLSGGDPEELVGGDGAEGFGVAEAEVGFDGGRVDVIGDGDGLMAGDELWRGSEKDALC